MARRTIKQQVSFQIDPLTGWEDEHLPVQSFHSFSQKTIFPVLKLKPVVKPTAVLSPLSHINIGVPLGNSLRSKVRMSIHQSAILGAASTLAECRDRLQILQKSVPKAKDSSFSRSFSGLPPVRIRRRQPDKQSQSLLLVRLPASIAGLLSSH